MSMMTVPGRTVRPDCSICGHAESVVRSIITEPLVVSVSTWVCADCYPINKRATDSLLAGNGRLVAVEVAA